MRPLSGRPFGRFGRPKRRLRPGLVQFLCVLAGLALGLLLPRLTTDATVASSRVTEILVVVGFGVLGLVTLIFSLLFLVVQWAFANLSPRLNLFRDDPIVWRTFGSAIGVFVFSVTAALVIADQTKVSVVVTASEVVAVLAAFALIRNLQMKAFASIQLAPTLSAIAAQGRAILDDLHPSPGTADRTDDTALLPLHRAVTWPHRQAVLQQLDLAGLVTGQERTFHQDPLFAFRLLADIGRRARALSPAVNDPATTVTQAWSPIGGITFYRDGAHSSTLQNVVIVGIAERHGKSPAQVMLRWHLQQGRSVIPKSTKEKRIAENIDVFDFELSADEIAAIDDLDTDWRGGPEPSVITLEAYGRAIPEA